MYVTRKAIYISFEYDLEWIDNLTSQDGYQSPCFAFKIIKNGNLYDPHNLMLLGKLRLTWYISMIYYDYRDIIYFYLLFTNH